MATEISTTYENVLFGAIRVLGTSEEPLFNANDLCSALGYINPRKALTDHVDTPDVTKRYIGVITGKKNDGTDAIQNVESNYVNESGLYALIFGSTLPKAKEFKRWVTAEVLPSIRKTGSYEVPKPQAQELTLQDKIMWVDALTNALHLNEVSRLKLYGDISAQYQMALPIPDYVPSHGVLKSATELLKENDAPMTIREFNACAVACGLLRVESRQSSHGKRKAFKVLTEEGMKYGENQVNPKNPKETQPLWFSNKFKDVLKRVGNFLNEKVPF